MLHPLCSESFQRPDMRRVWGRLLGRVSGRMLKGTQKRRKPHHPAVTQAGRYLGPRGSRRHRQRAAVLHQLTREGRGEGRMPASRPGAKEVTPGTVQFQMKALSFQTPWDLPPQLLSLPASSLSRKLLGSADHPHPPGLLQGPQEEPGPTSRWTVVPCQLSERRFPHLKNGLTHGLYLAGLWKGIELEKS